MRGGIQKKGKNYYAVVYDAIDPATAKIAVAQYLDPTRRASHCHASQIRPYPDNLLARVITGFLLGTTALGRVYPDVQRGERIERDVFQNVQH